MQCGAWMVVDIGVKGRCAGAVGDDWFQLPRNQWFNVPGGGT